MPKNPFPAYDWYPKDILTSENVTAMSPEAELAYRRLLDWAWLANPPCTLPKDDAVLADLSRVKDRWPEVRGQVLRMFEEVGGRLRNKKQHKIFREKIRIRREKKRAGKLGGAKSAESRAQKTKQRLNSACDLLEAKSNPPSPSPSSSSVPYGTGVKAADVIFGKGIEILMRAGLEREVAASFLGKLRKETKDDARVAAAVMRAEQVSPSAPKEWLVKAVRLEPGNGRKPKKYRVPDGTIVPSSARIQWEDPGDGRFTWQDNAGLWHFVRGEVEELSE